MWHHLISREDAGHAEGAQAEDHIPGDAIDQQHGAEGQDHQGRLPEVGLHDEKADEYHAHQQCNDLPRHLRTAGVLRQEPCGNDHESRLGKFGGLKRDRPDVDPAVRALDLGSEEKRRHHQAERAEEYQKPSAAGIARREEGERHQHWHCKGEVEELTLDEVEGVSPDALRHGRARRHGDEHARGHEQQHGEHQAAVHRKPPAREKAAITTSEQHGHLLELSSRYREAGLRP